MNRYEEYKKVNLPWLKEIPTHWEIIPISHVFEERRERNNNGNNQFILSVMKNIGVIPYTDKGNVGNKASENIENYKVVYPNDLVLNSMNMMIGSLGKSNYKGVLSQVYYVLKLMNSTKYNIDYLNYLFKNKVFHESFRVLGKGILDHRLRVPIQLLKYEKILIPAINEQEQIANYLDWKINEIDRLIQIEKEKIKELKTLMFNVIAEFVLRGIDTQNYKKSKIKWIDDIPNHWNEVSIRGCVNIIRGNSSFTKDDLKNKGKYVGLQYGKVYKTEIIDSEFHFYVSDKFYKISQVANRNDIIIVSTSETVEDLGHTSFYNRDDIGLIGGEQILLKPLNNINSKYLFYLSKIFRTQLQLCATGIKVYRFKISDLKQIYIPLPPIKEQEKIVSNIEYKLKLLDERVKNNYDLIKELELLKQSLISEVVTGKIDVRNIVIPEYEKVTVLDDEIEEFDEMEDIEDGD